jgi:hypothetical protein
LVVGFETFEAKLMVDWFLPGPALARAPPVDRLVVGIVMA